MIYHEYLGVMHAHVVREHHTQGQSVPTFVLSVNQHAILPKTTNNLTPMNSVTTATHTALTPIFQSPPCNVRRAQASAGAAAALATLAALAALTALTIETPTPCRQTRQRHRLGLGFGFGR